MADQGLSSLEVSWYAGFAIVDESSLDEDRLKIKDVPIWGAVVGKNMETNLRLTIEINYILKENED